MFCVSKATLYSLICFLVKKRRLLRTGLEGRKHFVSMATRVEAARDVRLMLSARSFWTCKCFPDRFMNFDGFQD